MNFDNGMSHKNNRTLYFHLVLLVGWCFCNIGLANINSHQISKGEVPQGLSSSEWSNIQSQIAEKQYKSRPHLQGGFFAKNNSHNWNIHYKNTGVTSLTPKNGDDYKIDLKLNAFGYQQLTPITRPIDITQQDNAVTYQWSKNLKEVWTNSAQSLEQWFILEQRPKNNTENDQLKIELTLTTDLSISQQADGLHFSNAQDIDISYNKLKVWDKDGTILPSKMFLDNNTLTLQVDDTQANYPLTIDPVFQQQAYLKASNAGEQDYLGTSVAISGDTMVVGAYAEDGDSSSTVASPNDFASNAGAVYVFIRDGDVWSQQAYLKASNAGAGDSFGVTVAISGDTVVVGAPFESGDSSSTVLSPNNSTFFAGAGYVFIRDGFGDWSQQAYLKTSNAGEQDFFGNSVAVSEDTVIVSAYQEDGDSSSTVASPNDFASNAGAVYVFIRDGDVWSQQAYLKASNAGAGDSFGVTVAISGDTVVVGAYVEDGNSSSTATSPNDSALSAGAAYVFTRNELDDWNQQAYLKASNAEAQDSFGISVAVSGDIVVAGAYFEDGDSSSTVASPNGFASNAGAAYVFIRDGFGDWSQQAYLKASNAEVQDSFGTSVAIFGDAVVVGVLTEDGDSFSTANMPNNNTADSGAVYVFTAKSNFIFDDGFESVTLKTIQQKSIYREPQKYDFDKDNSIDE